MLTPIPCAVYICPGDPWNAPRGGQTAFAKQALNAFGGKWGIVAPSEDGKEPVGKWFLSKWNDEVIWRFNIGSYAPKNKSRRPLIPRRIVFRNLIKKHICSIREFSTNNLFCDSPELLDVLSEYHWGSFCYRFAGVNDPVANSRYRYLRGLAKIFHRRTMTSLRKLKPDLILASADMEAVDVFRIENQNYLEDFQIVSFPTRFDASIFYLGDAQKERVELGWKEHDVCFTIVGRLCWVKGWKLALDAMAILKRQFPRLLLDFVGDGEDRAAIEKYVRESGLEENVTIEGFLPPKEVRRRLTASNVCLVTSYQEGWSVATTEALACGKPIVSTLVSGTRDMVHDGVNGRIVFSRDPEEVALRIRQALTLKGAAERSLELSKKYSSRTLANDWKRLWDVMR